MRTIDIIKKKRDGLELDKEEIDYIITGLLNETIPAYQITAFLMAVYFNAMTKDEIFEFTLAMMKSGMLDLQKEIKGIKVDKHSTGGVGDKLTLTIAPIVACADVYIPMISGRGLGHTGGTLDKLESIPGFRTSLDTNTFIKNLHAIRLAIISQSEDMVPADKRLYALRDVTATVDSIPLIASSIMSKKLALGSDCLVLDVKSGNGAFIKDRDKTKELAETLVWLGKQMGKKVVAIITNMDEPLGCAVGNSLEVIEAIDVLRGNGPEDVRSLTLEISAWMLLLAYKAASLDKAKDMAAEYIKTGSAIKKFEELIRYQYGDERVIYNYNLLPVADNKMKVNTPISGFIEKIDTEKIGIASCILGAGRTVVDSKIDHSVGILINKKVGEYVEKGTPLATIYFNNKDNCRDALDLVTRAYYIDRNQVTPQPLVQEIIS